MATLTSAEKVAIASYVTGKPAEPFRMPAASAPEGLAFSVDGR